MRLYELSADQYRRYFETRLREHRLRKSGIGHMALCPFHEDRNPSLSVNLEKGVWKCHACGLEGGLIDFERKWSKCDEHAALGLIAGVLGLSQGAFTYGGDKTEAVYDYTDVFGRTVFQVLRKPGKKFVQRRPDEKGGWIYKTEDVEVIPYNLPRVATSKQILVVEGEKDADNLTAALKDVPGVAATTCARGAGKWRDSYSAFFAGKQVAILPDNDEPGRAHAQDVARSSYRYTRMLKVVDLPGLGEKGDVSDFLKTRPASDIIEIIRQAKQWRPPEEETSLFMTVSRFEEKSADQIEWLVEGVIQRGANGLIIARPKAGKSYLVLDLALAIAAGQNWLDYFVPRRARVALVSREDTGALTQWREKKLRSHRQLNAAELDGWLYINAKGMGPKVVLDNELEMKSLTADLKRYQTEFLILDVMRVLHSYDENDNTEMQKVIDVLNRIQDDVGCSICLVHHDNKKEEATLTERARGASTIAGYAEFIGGVRVVDDNTWTREFCCELKAGIAPAKIYWRIEDTAENAIKVARVEWTPPERGRRKKSEASQSTEFDPTEFQ